MGRDTAAQLFQYPVVMQKQRVLLVCSQHLFGESLDAVLRAAQDMEILGPWEINEEVCQRLETVSPDVVVIASENPHNRPVTRLIASIIERYPELSVIRAGLTDKTLRVFSTHSLPARGADLVEAIRSIHRPDLSSHPLDEV